MIRPIWFVEPALSVLARSQEGAEPALVVEATRTRSSDQQYEALLSGEADVAITAMDNVFAWNRRGEADDFRVVAQVEATTPLVLMGRPGFDGARDLRRAKILVDAPANGFVIALRAFLAERGALVDESCLVPAGGVTERCEALLAGRGDVTLLGPPFDAAAQAAGALMLGRIQERYPAFPGQGAVIRMSGLDRFAPALAAWLDHLEQARRRFAADPDKARATLVAAGFPEQAVASMVETLPPRLTPDPAGIDLLIEHRRILGLPGGDAIHSSLVEPLPRGLQATAI